MKDLHLYITEKLVLNKDTFKNGYKYFPKTRNELKKIINQLIKERKDDNIIDLNDIDTSEITNMSSLFSKFNMKNIDISKWDVSNVTNMQSMFFSCGQLKSIGDLSNWDVSSVENMNFTFYQCCSLANIGDISNWKMNNIKEMLYMFYECTNLKFIGDIDKWNISNNVKYSEMFKYSDIQNIPSWYK